ncbi:TOP3 [[Candida] subhashii]|uniref:DNA topoisomerase n=1 Tax=[Candida] subhashii TaxID=561895 RepID=A0A8J5QNL9_9ASCO|nr:TOP3 [[Candida] subhashii]KAG7664854.1 TOP3 [[Candida] subhashii]
MKVLCVAEKPSIAKSVAQTLGGGRVTIRNTKSKYIKNYDFTFIFPGVGSCDVTMTSALGHITGLDLPECYGWGKCPPGRLFDAEVLEKVNEQNVYDNITNEARRSNKLMIWTDCDREGEYIGYEIFSAAKKGNSRLQISEVWRSKFSHLERNHIIAAATNPVQLDMKAVNAVACRTELDFRVGLSFTRLLTDSLKQRKLIDTKSVASYGTCQFPTLGFVVDRYKRVKSFVPEPFWYIDVEIYKENKKTSFNWVRGHLFDRLFVVLLYENCLSNDFGTITKLETKPKNNWRPLPLTTVELQKDCSKFFKMTAKQTLDAAESLYNKGFISYPRTETDKYPASMDLRSLFDKQQQDPTWGAYAASLLNSGHETPRNGSHDDKAHPAIHPVNYVSLNSLNTTFEKKVYEYVVRRFLACCSKDAVGQLTSATLQWGNEFFTASGLMVLERNYLDIFIYKKWESSKQLPRFQEGEQVKISSGKMKEGKTSPPNHMTESELISLMDANGIGTDATIADHIDKITKRGYIAKPPRTNYLVPSPLGMGLIEGLDKLNFEDISLSKPFLRRSLELSLQEIVNGTKTKEAVLEEVKQIYKQAFGITSQKMNILIQECGNIIQQFS